MVSGNEIGNRTGNGVGMIGNVRSLSTAKVEHCMDRSEHRQQREQSV
jgi:hypothetical protein